MVNVAGRSKGCYTCRRRKIKCDEQRPVCRRCQRTGLVCDGFEHPLKVIFDQSCFTVSNTTKQDPSPASLARRLPHKCTDVVVRSSTSYSLPAELDLSAFEDNVQATFLVAKFLSIVEFGRKTVLGAWGTMDPAHYPSRRALEASFFGIFHHRPDICKVGSMWYGQSLKKLARDLDDPGQMLSLSALRSTVVLTMYELISPSSSAWVQHAGGVGRLLEARGPHRHQAAEERMLLEAARPLILAKAVAEGKRCFLEKSDWVTVPWELEPGGKPLVEKLFDAGCPIPGLVEDRKKLSVQKQRLASATAKNNLQPQPDLNDAYHSVASALAARCEQCIHQIRAWKNEWDMQGKVSEVWSISSVPSAGSDYPYAELGLPLAFSDLKRASRYSMYNALLSTFLTIAYEARYEASTLSTDIISNAINESLILKPGLATPRTDHDYLLKQRHDCAIEICRSVPYHNLPGPDHQVSGIHSIMFPLMAAQQVVAPGGEVFRYIDGVFPRCDNFGAFKDLQILPPGVRMSSLPHIQPAQAFYKPMLYTSACGAESAVPL